MFAQAESHGLGTCVATMSTPRAIVALEGKVEVRHDHVLFWLGQEMIFWKRDGAKGSTLRLSTYSISTYISA